MEFITKIISSITFAAGLLICIALITAAFVIIFGLLGYAVFDICRDIYTDLKNKFHSRIISVTLASLFPIYLTGLTIALATGHGYITIAGLLTGLFASYGSFTVHFSRQLFYDPANCTRFFKTTGFMSCICPFILAAMMIYSMITKTGYDIVNGMCENTWFMFICVVYLINFMLFFISAPDIETKTEQSDNKDTAISE